MARVDFIHSNSSNNGKGTILAVAEKGLGMIGWDCDLEGETRRTWHLSCFRTERML